MDQNRIKELEARIVSNYFRPHGQMDADINEIQEEYNQLFLRPTSSQVTVKSEPDPEQEAARQRDEQNYLPFAQSQRSQQENFDYVARLRQKTIRKILKSQKNQDQEQIASVSGYSVDADASIAARPEDLAIYDDPRFNFRNHKCDHSLPINRQRDEIIFNLKINNVIIVQGNTGCGKTTQVPQIILDDCARNKLHCKIVVTQPRRIAAKSIAKRVSDERDWTLGSVCGYKVSMEKSCSEETRLFYVTTGFLLENLVANENELFAYTHIILDEIHDRDTDTDLLILLVKILLLKQYKGKIVLMSATLNPTILTDYFKDVSHRKYVPVIRCEMSLFTVKEFYYDDLKTLLKLDSNSDCSTAEFDLKKPGLFKEQIDVLCAWFNYIDYKEQEIYAKNLNVSQGNNFQMENGFLSVRGAVLIFVPGMYEIDLVRENLRQIMEEKRLNLCILHSEISLDQQMHVYDRAADGYRKVILSTSIAESSLTVPDVKYVVDFCLTKRMYTDPGTLFSQLELEWAAKSNCRQRLGRAGRVHFGICVRLVPKDFYRHCMSDFPEPSILREPLDKLILNLKRYCKDRKPAEMLALALTPPPLDNIERTILSLKEAGALTLYKNREICVDDGDLTYAGHIMASLPTDIRLGKLILFGHCFGKLGEAIVLAAGLSVKSVYIQRYKSKLEYYKTKFHYSNGLQCDFNAILNAYNFWQDLKSQPVSMKRKIEHLENNGLNYKSLKDLEFIKRKIEDRLKQYGLEVNNSEHSCFGGRSNEPISDEDILNDRYLIKFMVAGAFFPNYYKTTQLDEKNVIKELSGRDPHTTVCLKGFDDHSAILYHAQINRTFKTCSENLITHYEGNKAFVEFKDFYQITNKIANGVYFALKMNLLKIHPEKNGIFFAPVRRDLVRDLEAEIGHLRRLKGKEYQNSFTSRVTTGSADLLEDTSRLLKDLNEFKIDIFQVPSVNVIWARVNEPEYKMQMKSIEDYLGNARDLKVLRQEEIYVGALCVAFHFYESLACGFYRARITKINSSTKSVNLFYIDYGNEEEKDFNLLFEMSDYLKKIPCQAFQCQLINLRLNPLRNPVREERMLNEFTTLISKIKCMKARIYSIVNNVIRLTLLNADNELYERDISSDLIKIGLFEKCDEDELSKYKHEERMNTIFMSDSHKSKNEWINISNRELEKQLEKVKFDTNSTLLEGKRIAIRSPLASKLNGMTRFTSAVNVLVDSESVNCIILDEEHQIKCSSLLISASRITELDRCVKLRNTTLFPKIKGLVSLCLLTFSPQVEFRFDAKAKRYTGALCGLGFDRNTKKPLCTENDIEDEFEVEFTEKDIKRINAVRHIFNTLIGNGALSSSYLNDPEKKNLKNLQSDCRKAMLELLKQPKDTIETKYFEHPHKWNKLNEEYLKPMTQTEEVMNRCILSNRAFYGPIRGIDFSLMNSQTNVKKEINQAY